jgi:hypothetical protein
MRKDRPISPKRPPFDSWEDGHQDGAVFVLGRCVVVELSGPEPGMSPTWECRVGRGEATLYFRVASHLAAKSPIIIAVDTAVVGGPTRESTLGGPTREVFHSKVAETRVLKNDPEPSRDIPPGPSRPEYSVSGVPGIVGCLPGRQSSSVKDDLPGNRRRPGTATGALHPQHSILF